MVSIVIPAHNEEQVIGRCLKALTAGSEDNELEVIVVCNGCSDDTAALARRFGAAVKVIETPVASKSHALNLGDDAATQFPRFYIDADVSISMNAIREVARVLNDSVALAAAPRMKVELSGSSWMVRAFYRVWLQSSYHKAGMIGSGVYALSREGRSRFAHFPSIIADDGFVYNLFSATERQMVRGESFVVCAPHTLIGLIKIMTRSRLGEYELRKKGLCAAQQPGTSWQLLHKMANTPPDWLAFGVYCAVNIITRLRAWWQLKKLGEYRWERDDTSRQTIVDVG
jgi:glycosyltransferase involved in cell wall biosynthesis